MMEFAMDLQLQRTAIKRIVISTLVVLTTLIPTLYIARLPVRYMISGDIFRHSFDRQTDIGWFVGGGSQRWMFVFAVLWGANVISNWLALQILGRTSRAKFMCFIVLTLICATTLFLVLVPPFYLLIQYICALGFTLKRLLGILCCIAGFSATVGVPIYCLRRSATVD